MIAQEILTGAYAHNHSITPNKAIVDATEGLQLIIRAMNGMSLFASSINPAAISGRDEVAFDTDGWPRPEDALVVFYREDEDGVEVALVPIDNRAAELELPAVYFWGNKYYRSNDIGPEDDAPLIMFYGKKLESPANLAATIDAAWPEAFNELLQLEVAILMNIKLRMDVTDQLRAERDRWAQMFIAWLERMDIGLRSQFSSSRLLSPNAKKSAAQFLAGGSAIAAG